MDATFSEKPGLDIRIAAEKGLNRAGVLGLEHNEGADLLLIVGEQGARLQYLERRRPNDPITTDSLGHYIGKRVEELPGRPASDHDPSRSPPRFPNRRREAVIGQLRGIV
jgi:hypothetical protein